MDFNDKRSKTVISTVITKNDISKYLNKTPDQISNKEIIIKEVFRQLRTFYGDIPDYDFALMEQNYYENKKWNSNHTAFMTTKLGFINAQSNKFSNLYNCGMQNGKSEYSFTSLESAVINAMSLIHDLIPESKKDWKIKEIFTLRFLLFFILIIVLFVFFIFYSR
jgi:hypothetical protein